MVVSVCGEQPLCPHPNFCMTEIEHSVLFLRGISSGKAHNDTWRRGVYSRDCQQRAGSSRPPKRQSSAVDPRGPARLPYVLSPGTHSTERVLVPPKGAPGDAGCLDTVVDGQSILAMDVAGTGT